MPELENQDELEGENMAWISLLPNFESAHPTPIPSLPIPYNHQSGMKLLPEVMTLVVAEYIKDFWTKDIEEFEERKGEEDDLRTGSRRRKQWVELFSTIHYCSLR